MKLLAQNVKLDIGLREVKKHEEHLKCEDISNASPKQIILQCQLCRGMIPLSQVDTHSNQCLIQQ